MVKKFLLSAAVVGALATSAMAYDYIPKTMTYNSNINLSNGYITLNGNKGNALIYPAFFAQTDNGMNWSSTVNVINTSDKTVVAKVVLFRGDDSKEILDFNIGLSPNDEWQARIYVDDKGYPHIVSKDKSGIVDDKVLKIENPDGTVSYPKAGYIEIIGMAAVNGVDLEGTDITDTFEEDVSHIRNLQGDIQYDNGVPTAPINAPYVDLSKIANTTYSYVEVPNDALIGTVRVTDSANNKDMVLNAIGLNIYNSNASNNEGLLYLQGESANIGDVTLKPIQGAETATDVKSLKYDADLLVQSLDNIAGSKKSVYMTYGKAEPQNMYALFTTPLKRLVFRGVDTDYNGNVALKTDGLYYNNNLLFSIKEGLQAIDVNGNLTDAATNPTNFSFSVYTKIYNMDEQPVKNTFYSPATTPAITINNELQSSGTDYNNNHTLAYYIKEAQKNDSSYGEGFIILKNTVYNQIIPSIVTQMLATKASETSSQYITNWITPVYYDNK